MNYLEILLYYVNNPTIFFDLAGKFFDEMHAACIYEDCDEDYIINEPTYLPIYKNF
jgi:hypothetical protein